MPESVIRPTLKLIKAGYAVAALLLAGSIFVHATYLREQPFPFLPAACALLLLWPLARHARRGLTKATLTGDKLRYETGFLSKSTQTIQISKVQNVRVDRSLAQRLLGTGDIAIETAGETSRLTIANIDAPQAVADRIVAASQESTGVSQ